MCMECERVTDQCHYMSLTFSALAVHDYGAWAPCDAVLSL